MTLNIRQQRFVREYIIDLNPEQAAIRAGYSPRIAQSQGQKLLEHDEIIAAIEKELESLRQRAEVDEQWVIAGLKENAERAMQAVPVRDSKGNDVGEWTYQGTVANRAIELIGKHMGMFKNQSPASAEPEDDDVQKDETFIVGKDVIKEALIALWEAGVLEVTEEDLTPSTATEQISEPE